MMCVVQGTALIFSRGHQLPVRDTVMSSFLMRAHPTMDSRSPSRRSMFERRDPVVDALRGCVRSTAPTVDGASHDASG